MSILVSQRVISEEIAKIHANAQDGETQPRLDFPPYRSAVLRQPLRDLRHADPEGAELFAPTFGRADVGELESDLTAGGAGEPIGERIMVRGRVVDGGGRPVSPSVAKPPVPEVAGLAAAGIPVGVPRRGQQGVGHGLDRACAPLAQRHDLPRQGSSDLRGCRMVPIRVACVSAAPLTAITIHDRA